MKHIYSKIQGWFTYDTLYSEIVASVNANAHIVEVGSWKGKSAAFMAVEILNSGKAITFDCVDTWMGSIEHLDVKSKFYEPLLKKPDGLFNKFLENIVKVQLLINPIKMCSVDAAKKYNDESLDFVFIDASHVYEDVKADIQAWLPKIKKGAILAGHDYNYGPVKKAVDELLSGVISRPAEKVWLYVK